MSKGSRPRPCNKKEFDENFERVFGPKKLNIWTDAPSKEEPGETNEKVRTGPNLAVSGQAQGGSREAQPRSSGVSG